jgi:hypothetical protein
MHCPTVNLPLAKGQVRKGWLERKGKNESLKGLRSLLFAF